MPEIKFVKNYPALQANVGDNLMKLLLKAQVPVASSCHGDGICSKCHVKVLSGDQNLSPESSAEMNTKIQHNVPSEHRLSCQCQILGDICIDTSYW